MKKIRVKIEIEDQDYQKRLSDYIKIKGFSLFEINEKTYDLYVKDRQACLLLKTKKEEKVINKHQSAQTTMEEMIEIFSRHQSIDFSSEENRSKVIGVTSSQGGEGKTFLAQRMAVWAKKQGKKVLYINLNGMACHEGIFTCEKPKDLSLLFYYLKKESEKFNTYLEMYKNYDPLYKIHYLSGVYPSCDIFLEEKEVNYFMTALKRNSLYDYIILDIPLYPHRAYTNILKMTYFTVYIKSSDGPKQRAIEDYLRAEEVKLVPVCKGSGPCLGILLDQVSENDFNMENDFYQTIESIFYQGESLV